MAKKRSDTAVAEQPAPTVTEPVQANAPAESHGDKNGNGTTVAPPRNGPRKPDVTFSVFSDRTTRLEVNVYEEQVTYDEKLSVRHNITMSRSYLNADGKWVTNYSYRAHDLPLVRSLLDRAHAWCVERRTDDSTCPF